MNFSEAMFYKNYLTSDFHTNTVISSLFAYSSANCRAQLVTVSNYYKKITFRLSRHTFSLGNRLSDYFRNCTTTQRLRRKVRPLRKFPS